MITHTNDVESLLGRYEPGMILVGPLLSLSMSASNRCFYVAGNGGKVYETISLGFVEFQADAQTQRADFIERLESRFAEVLTFGSHLELARAAHTRWPNEETAKILTFAELEVKLKPSEVEGQQESIDDDRSFAGDVPGGKGKLLVNEVATEPTQSMPVLRLVQSLEPLTMPVAALSQSVRGDRAVTAQQRHSGPTQDDVASAILRLKSPAEMGAVSRLPVVSARTLTSIVLRYCAVGGAVALTSAVITWAIVPPSTRQVVDEAGLAPVPASSISVSRNKVPSQAEAAVPPSDPNYVTEVKEPAPQAEPTPAATAPPSPPSQISASPNDDSSQAEAAASPSVPSQHTKTNEPAPQAEPTPAATVPPSPPSQPLQVASAPNGAAPISGPQSSPAQVGGTAVRLDAEEIATLVNRGTDSLKSGDVASARLLLRRAAEAGSATAALMLGSTFDPLIIQQFGTIGVVPNVAQARQWYEQAAALGSEAASQRLAKLAHTGQ
jgi:hypothetical protein